MQSLPAVRDHVIVLEQHAIESARVAGVCTSKTKRRANQFTIYIFVLFNFFFYFDILKKVQSIFARWPRRARVAVCHSRRTQWRAISRRAALRQCDDNFSMV
jgi:hypothetical protein